MWGDANVVDTTIDGDVYRQVRIRAIVFSQLGVGEVDWAALGIPSEAKL